VISSLLVSPVEWSYLNTDMRKFESLLKDESWGQSADTSKAYRKPWAFNCTQKHNALALVIINLSLNHTSNHFHNIEPQFLMQWHILPGKSGSVNEGQLLVVILDRIKPDLLG